MTAFSAKPGFALPAVLFIAVLGILLGIGRLVVFNNQCRIRIDRQQEYEKVFAVRSVLNRLQNWSGQIAEFPEEGGRDGFVSLRTDSGRTVNVLLHPADAIFPLASNANHFCVNRVVKNAGTGLSDRLTRVDAAKYRYVSSIDGDPDIRSVFSEVGDYICLMPRNATPDDRCRLSLDMSETGRWSDDSFGRRYAFNVNSLCSMDNGGTNDLLRLILRRKRHGEIFNGPAGSIHKANEDWRPSQANESVIYAELYTGGAMAGSFTAWTQRRTPAGLQDPVLCVSNIGVTALNSFGIQMAGQRLTLFQSFSPRGNFKQYNFSGAAQIPAEVYFDFTNNVMTTLSTNLVMELEVVASRSRNVDGDTVFSDSGENKFSNFEVFPAFEFAILIENENEKLDAGDSTEPELATVVHLDVNDFHDQRTCTAVTYDTHGTEIKGWRTGEHMAWGLIR